MVDRAKAGSGNGQTVSGVREALDMRPLDGARSVSVPIATAISNGSSAWHPAIDVRQNPHEIVVYADIPGVDEDDIHVQVDAATIVISGDREFDHDTEDAEEFVRIERQYGPFECVVKLPDNLDVQRITAKYKRGVLKLRVPRKGGHVPVVIPVTR